MNNTEINAKKDLVDESSSSFLGQMLPQCCGYEQDGGSIDDLSIFYNDDEIFESAIMVAESSLIKTIKQKISQIKSDIAYHFNTKDLIKACKLYSEVETSKSRMKVMLTKNPALKSTDLYKDCQRNLIVSEKKLRQIKKRLKPEELADFNKYCKDLNTNLNAKMKEAMADIDAAMKAKPVTTTESVNELCTNCNSDEDKETIKHVYECLEKDAILFSTNAYKAMDDYNSEIFTRASSYLGHMCSFVDSTKTFILTILKLGNNSERNLQHQLILSSYSYLYTQANTVVELYRNTKCSDPEAEKAIGCLYQSMKELSSMIDGINSNNGNIVNYDLSSRFCCCFDSLKTIITGLCTTCRCAVEYTIEAANIDKAITKIIDKLNTKGYRTKYSSAGHNNLKPWKDGDDDSKYEGKLHTDGRIMFRDDYDFPDAPKYWYWRTVDGKDYLDVTEIKYDPKDGTPSEAFQKWKNSYLGTLDRWVDNLPDRMNAQKSKENKDEDSVVESVNDSFKRMLDDMELDMLDL